jgi:hypothetical protein
MNPITAIYFASSICLSLDFGLRLVLRAWEIWRSDKAGISQFYQSEEASMYRALRDEYGLFASVCMLMVFPDTVETMASIERHILQSEDEAALALKASFVTDLNLEAVAVRMIHA